MSDPAVAEDRAPPPGGGPSRPFILRPIATSLLMVAIVLAGLVGMRLMPLSALPEVDYPTIQVQTLYPGASPDVMARTVTAPLERQFGQMPGLARMGSASSAGASVVTLQFNLGLSLDVAEQEVQAAMNAAGNLLPADLPAPPVYAKVNPADAPVLTLAITSDTLPLTEVQNLVNTQLAQKISQVPGWASTPCAPPSPRPTPMPPRAVSTGPCAPIPSTPTTSCSPSTTTSPWWWPIATARPCGSRMWPRWSTAPRT
jgi:hypothetical protein